MPATLQQQYDLSNSPLFQQRIQAALVNAALAVFSEVANEVQTVQLNGSPTGGSFTATLEGVTSGAIPFNATASALQTVLQAMSNIGQGNIVCTGGPFPAPITITFTGNRAGVPQQLFGLGVNSLTGGASPAPGLARSVAGIAVVSHVQRAALASKILAAPATYAQLVSLGVTQGSQVQTDFLTTGNQSAVTDADIAAQITAIFNAYA